MKRLNVIFLLVIAFDFSASSIDHKTSKQNKYYMGLSASTGYINPSGELENTSSIMANADFFHFSKYIYFGILFYHYNAKFTGFKVDGSSSSNIIGPYIKFYFMHRNNLYPYFKFNLNLSHYSDVSYLTRQGSTETIKFKSKTQTIGVDFMVGFDYLFGDKVGITTKGLFHIDLNSYGSTHSGVFIGFLYVFK